VYTGFWWEIPRKIKLLKYTGMDERIIFTWIIKKWDLELWTG
jgi:hypothetical protein